MTRSAQEPEEARDLAAARTGDTAAFARLYDRHAPVVLSICRVAVGGSMAEAEDALQETFVRAHRLLHRVQDSPGLGSWLNAVARRVCAERRRAAGRRRAHEARGGAHGDPSPSGPAASERRETIDRLTEAMGLLDERERLAIHLHYLDADPARTAADVLRVSRSGYYKLLARARGRLASLMQEVTST